MKLFNQAVKAYDSIENKDRIDRESFIKGFVVATSSKELTDEEIGGLLIDLNAIAIRVDFNKYGIPLSKSKDELLMLVKKWYSNL